MEKEFIPYEQALVLKELGFNRRTLAQYNTRQGNAWMLTFDFSGEGQYPNSSSACVAPTFSQAFRWFREKYNLSGLIEIGTQEFSYQVFNNKGNRQLGNESMSYNGTYEEAELECLKKLIEIAKK